MRLPPVLTRSLSLRAEDGLALVMVMGILFFFSIVTVTATTLATSTESTAAVSSGNQNSYALAETGINNALSVLEDVPTNDPQNANLLGSAASPITTTTPTGSVSWYGVYNEPTLTWTITSTSTVPSPVGGRGALHTTLTRTVTLTANLNGDWDRIYQDDASSCLTVPDGTNIPSNTTAHGDLCLNGASITGSGTKVTVGGNVILTPAAQAGTNAADPAGTGAGWTNSQNIAAQDNTTASASIAASSDGSALQATNFGFTIPTGSTITGITVKFVRWASSSSPGCCIHDLHVQLLKNGVVGGTDKATSTYWPQAGASGPAPGGASVNYGSATDLWGQTWTPADIDASNFGVQFTPHNYKTSAVTAYADFVQITVNYTPPADDAHIGTSSTPVKEADIGGTCNYNAQGAHTPCTATDHVWGTTVTSGPPAMNKPTADFSYWYNNAAPGPKHGCDVHTGTPPTFDSNTSYDNNLSNQNIAPSGSSYTCIAKDGSGNVIGQISWNATTQVMTLSGVIFIDGEADFGTHDYTVHYQGRAAIYASGGSHIDSQVCAGGSGSTGCLGPNMSNWDPTQNLLVMVVGDKEAANHNDCKIDETDSAFQGVYWSKNTCDIHGGGAAISGPIIATDISIGAGTSFYPWPQLGAILPGVNAGAASYVFTLGPQSG